MFPEEQKLKSRKRTSKHDEGNETSPWLTAAGHVKWTRSCTERSLCPERQRNLCLHVPEIGTSEKSKIKMKLRIFYSRRPGAAERHFPSGLDVCLLSSFSLLSLRIYAYADIFISYFRASPHNWRKKNTTKRSSWIINLFVHMFLISTRLGLVLMGWRSSPTECNGAEALTSWQRAFHFVLCFSLFFSSLLTTTGRERKSRMIPSLFLRQVQVNVGWWGRSSRLSFSHAGRERHESRLISRRTSDSDWFH